MKRDNEYRIGILFSLSGTTALVEKGQYQTALMTIELINQSEEYRGLKLIPVVEDIQSDPLTAAKMAEKLAKQGVHALVGPYTSACRKAILPILERYDLPLLYPTQVEGLESHPNVFYCGPTVNQQVLYHVPWLLENLGTRVFLIGSDYIFPRGTHRQFKPLIKRYGGEVVGELFLPLGSNEMTQALKLIEKAKPDFVFSTIVGSSIVPFYRQYREYGFDSRETPIVSSVTTELDIQKMGGEYGVGHYSTFPYFASIEREENQRFVKLYCCKYGQNEAINANMEFTYTTICLLAKALSECKEKPDLKKFLLKQKFEAPQGTVFFDPTNQHLWQWPRIGRVQENNQFEIVWSSDQPIRPDPWYSSFPEVGDDRDVLQKQVIDRIANWLPDGIVILSAQGDVLYMNAVAQELIGHMGYPWSRLKETIFSSRELPKKERPLPGQPDLFYLAHSIYRDSTHIGSMIFLKRKKHPVKTKPVSPPPFSKRIVGKDPRLMEQLEIAKIAAQTDENVLLLGESGTGKDVFAKVIHENSPRKDQPFIVVNCATLSKELIASELFGYEEGAFTGAKKGGKIGAFEAASGGTLFLDEIGEMPLELQATLLRALEDKAITRVGGTKMISVDTRVIASTNRNLKHEITYNGTFRSDLYYRLNVITIHLPPLRERRGDIPLLANHFLEELNHSRPDHRKKSFDASVFESFYQYPWPGNIRELRNVVQRAFYLSGSNLFIAQEHLPEEIRTERLSFNPSADHLTDSSSHKLKKAEKDIIEETLRKVNGNVRRAAQILGISRSTLYRKIDRKTLVKYRE
jgi:DNA-binding NtrC family response regulator/ABC-type branched-subunit amino acid transport system substrate-binding protein